jgi:hypothetical protein
MKAPDYLSICAYTKLSVHIRKMVDGVRLYMLNMGDVKLGAKMAMSEKVKVRKAALLGQKRNQTNFVLELP